MGNNHSQTVIPYNSDSESGFESNNDFFEVSFSELILESQFHSDLLNTEPESIVQPLSIFSSNIISTLISDPIAFSETQTIRDVWKTLICPNLSGSPENHSYIHQVLTVLFKFFKDRPEILMDRETVFRSDYLQNAKQEKYIPIPCNSTTQFSQLSVHPLYASITEQLFRESGNIVPKEEYSNNICSLVFTLQYLFTELLQKKSQSIGFDITPLEEPLLQIPLNNATFYPCDYTNLPSTKLPNLNYPNHSIISSDESNIYIVDRINDSTINIHRINLSDENIPISKRITTIPLTSEGSLDKNIGFAVSNGYGIIVQSKHHLLIKLPECKYISKISAKIQCPVTSDGYYIYSLSNQSKPNLSVFVINQDKNNNNIGLIRIHYTELKPKIPINDSWITFCNGPVLTVVSDKIKEGKHSHQYINFSVIDGLQITETYSVEPRYHIVSMTSDPWRRRMVEIIKQGREFTLIWLPNYSSQPLWISQESFETHLDTNSVHQSIRNIATFLSYYSIHLNGSSFRSFTYNKMFLMDTALFFSPCTPSVISSLVDAIDYFITFYKNKEHQNLVKEILLSLLRLLNLNLSNFSERTINNRVISVDSLLLRLIVNCFKQIFDPQSNLSFLKPIVYFTLANSFELLFSITNPQRNDAMNILAEALKLSSNSVRYYIVKQISKFPEFPSSIASTKMRNIFALLLDNLINDKPLSDSSILLLNSYMETLFLEMKKIYINNQGEFKQPEQDVNKCFCSFLGLVVETANSFFSNLGDAREMTNFEQRPFIVFLRKWLVLLEPFPQFNRASVEITAMIQPLYHILAKTITEYDIPLTISPEKKAFHEFTMIFYETFSILVNSIGALLDGGCEIKDIHQYLWLLKSILRDNLKMENVEEWYNDFKNKRKTEISKGRKIIGKRGVSYNIFREDRSTDSNLLQEFINRFLVENPSTAITNLMNYLHAQCKKGQQKPTAESKQVELVVFACLIKQLGLTNKLYLESIKFSTTNECNAMIFNNVINALHKITQKVILSKQKTQLYNQNAKRNSIQRPPTLSEQNDRFVEEIKKKAVFLLNVNPCLRFETNEYTKSSDSMLNNLTLFITSDSTVDEYFNVVHSIRKSFQHISTGFAISKTILENSMKNPEFKNCSYYMIEHLAQNTSILKFLDSNNSCTQKDNFQPYHEITSFLRSLCNFVVISKNKTTLSSPIVFFMSICMSISITDDILDAIDKLIDKLTID